jgi:cytochrome c-type biogenesis protein CcmH
MTVFLIGSVVLMVVAVFFVVRPLLRQSTKASENPRGTEQQALTLQILRDQQTELEQERSVGQLSEDAYGTAHAELQRRLLDELGSQDINSDASSSGDSSVTSTRPLAVALIFLIPLIAVAGYMLWGNPMALRPGATEPQVKMSPDKIVQMVTKLAARLKENPSDLDGWLKLAQAYKVMGRYAEAAEAYAKAESRVKEDAGLLASYAETLGMSSEKGLQGKPTVLLNAALKLNPKEPNVLLLSGAAAMERQDYKAAVTYWEQLLPMVEPGSEIEEVLKDSIERIRNKPARK